jgi:hypothetical protein
MVTETKLHKWTSAELAFIKLRRREGWTFRRIGDYLGVSESSAKRALARVEDKEESKPDDSPHYQLTDKVVGVSRVEGVITLRYGNGCNKWPDCFTCWTGEKGDCKAHYGGRKGEAG